MHSLKFSDIIVFGLRQQIKDFNRLNDKRIVCLSVSPPASVYVSVCPHESVCVSMPVSVCVSLCSSLYPDIMTHTQCVPVRISLFDLSNDWTKYKTHIAFDRFKKINKKKKITPSVAKQVLRIKGGNLGRGGTKLLLFPVFIYSIFFIEVQ